MRRSDVKAILGIARVTDILLQERKHRVTLRVPKEQQLVAFAALMPHRPVTIDLRIRPIRWRWLHKLCGYENLA